MMRKILVFFVILSLIISGCELLDLFSSKIKESDPYDENCNLKESYHKEWKKYSDFDYRIEANERSYEAKQYYNAVNDIAKKSGEIYSYERDMAIEEVMKKELIAYKQAIVTNHKKNLLKSFARLSFYTADTVWQHAVAGKQYGKLLTGPAKNGVELAGEAMKLINSYAGSNSSLALDTTKIEGQLNDVSRAGWMEGIASMGDPKKVSQEMVKKGIRYAMGVPESKLSAADFEILKNTHGKIDEINSMIADADDRINKLLWKKRALEQDVIHLESSLFDFEYDEKDRVDGMLIGECKQKLERQKK
jgi:hypothetical protein